MGVAPSTGIAIDAIEGLHLLAFAITRLALLIVAFGIGHGGSGERRAAGKGARSKAYDGEEIAPANSPLAWIFHRPPRSIQGATAPRAPVTRKAVGGSGPNRPRRRSDASKKAIDPG